jgi:ubiquinone/menaquinone biosynthesis C-methylase UbiE
VAEEPGKFDPRAAGLLLREKRGILPPQAVLRLLSLRPGQRLLDLGCGPGYFALPAAEAVRPGGVVAAVDVQPEMLDILRQRLPPDLPLLPVACREVELPFPDALFDAALAAHMLGECRDPVATLREVRRVLAPAASLLVVEWRPGPDAIGPPAGSRRTAEEVWRLLEAAHFRPSLVPSLGPHHYGLLAEPC